MKRAKTIFDLITLSSYESMSIDSTLRNTRDAVLAEKEYYAGLFARRLAQLAAGPIDRAEIQYDIAGNRIRLRKRATVYTRDDFRARRQAGFRFLAG